MAQISYADTYQVHKTLSRAPQMLYADKAALCTRLSPLSRKLLSGRLLSPREYRSTRTEDPSGHYSSWPIRRRISRRPDFSRLQLARVGNYPSALSRLIPRPIQSLMKTLACGGPDRFFRFSRFPEHPDIKTPPQSICTPSLKTTKERALDSRQQAEQGVQA